MKARLPDGLNVQAPAAVRSKGAVQALVAEQVILQKKRRFSRLAKVCLMLVLAAAGAVPLLPQEGYASVPALDTIRVALYMDNGKTIRQTVPTVTLSSEGGLQIGVRQPSGPILWAAPASREIRVSLDQYRVLLQQTADFNLASSLAKQLQAADGSAYITVIQRQGKPLYRVSLGQFGTKESAEAAKSKVLSGTNASLVDAKLASVLGPNYWSAGSYGSEAEAQKQADQLQQSGIAAYVAMQQTAAGTPSYEVWIGEAADGGQLGDVKLKVAAAGQKLSLQAVDMSLPYFVVRSDATRASSAASAVPHYYMNASGQKTWVQPKDASIQITEKSERKYRGSLELAAVNSKLAVINELPFEHYLYSVVGSELGEGWPIESLKAQAVAARTFALKLGMKYEVAHISDTTVDQAYKGLGSESPSVLSAVQATSGEVLMNKDGLITPVYSSNSGGMTGDPKEVWGNAVDYLKPVESAADEAAQQGKRLWHRALFTDGTTGYIHSDYATATGEVNGGGWPLYEVKGKDVNVRTAPQTTSPAVVIKKVNSGDRFVSLGQSTELTAYSWMRGPYSPEELKKLLSLPKGSPEIDGAIRSLEVTERGPSGRVTAFAVNGQTVQLANADSSRGVFGGLPSAKFEIEETGRYTILGADGAVREMSAGSGSIYVLDAGGKAQPLGGDSLAIGSGQQARDITSTAQYVIKGEGYGHGLGMSQWGARGLADAGYDYKQILEYYYYGVSIKKDGA
ncbi:SpoIID/LytB domain-containing protein [Paenibacillus sp. y28]|uniref:SpoIID/LytB domain-containing protein n=1 Tax=Paenibacillus sp. y28 TaxID=3129110 RepID=UPI003018D1E5